jgi:hypothetical protein
MAAAIDDASFTSSIAMPSQSVNAKAPWKISPAASVSAAVMSGASRVVDSGTVVVERVGASFPECHADEGMVSVPSPANDRHRVCFS